jgi:hypothetical protein
VNTWLLMIVLSLATFRLTRLVVKDDFPPVLWMRDRVAGGWRPVTAGELAEVTSEEASFPFRGDPESGEQITRYVYRWKWVPQWLADLVSCPWCASGWVSGALVLLASFTTGLPAPLLSWFAVWGAGSLLASRPWT